MLSKTYRPLIVAGAVALSLNLLVSSAAWATYSSLSDNALLYYNFNEASGNAVEQINGVAGDALNPVGDATRVATGTVRGNAASFDGAGDAFTSSISSFTGVPGSIWFLEFFINPNGDQAGGGYVAAGSTGSSNNPGILFDFEAGGVQNELEYFDPGGNRNGVVIPTNTWTHVGIAFYGNGSGGLPDDLREIYINGELALSDTGTFSSGFGLSSLTVGASGGAGASSFNGLVDELALYTLDTPTLTNLAQRQAFVAQVSAAHAAIPEPSTGLLLGFGLFGLVMRRKTRSRV